MPSRDAHIAAARQNEAALRHMLSSDDHLAWVVTIAFYKALHIMEAVFAADPAAPAHHTDDHIDRNRILKTTTRYQHFWKMYRPLWQASLVARYLRENDSAPTHDVFSAHLPKADVESRVLGHWLHQIEQSAEKYLGPNYLA